MHHDDNQTFVDENFLQVTLIRSIEKVTLQM